jgi:hypothetical protein
MVIGLDHFENAVRPDRRRTCELLLDKDERASILLLAGYSIQAVSDATLEAFEMREERMRSAEEKEHPPSKLRIAKAFSSTSRALKSLMFGNNIVRNQSVALTA